MKNRILFASGAYVSVIVLSAIGTEALAQEMTTVQSPAPNKDVVKTESADSGLIDIVVTAQRRAQNLQDVPIAINAFSEEAVEKRRIVGIQSLASSVPGFSISSFVKSQLNPSLRGGSSSLASAGAEQAVGLFIDDQYFGGAGDFEIDLFDVERIEVLRGPQGTLFGRNTTGGSINVVTRRPSKTMEGKVEATIGNYDALEAKGYISGPVAGNLLGSIAFSTRQRDGVSFNQTTGNHIDDVNRTSFRGKLLWEASPDLDVTAAVGYSRVNETGIARDLLLPDVPITNQDLIDLGFVNDNDPRIVQQPFDGSFKSRQWSGNLRAEYKLPNATLLSVTTYRDYDSTESEASALVGVPVVIFENGNSRITEAFSQELRYTSDYEGPFNWVGGLYFFKSDETRHAKILSGWDEGTFLGLVQSLTFCPDQTFGDFDIGVVTPSCITNYPRLFGPNRSFIVERNRTNSYSAFADANFKVTDQLTLLGGLRYTHDKKRFHVTRGGDPEFALNPPTGGVDPLTGIPLTGSDVTGKDSWGKLTYRAGFQYEPTDSLMIYGTRATGFRSGVSNGESAVELLGQFVAPETALSHEIGVKSRWLDNRLQLNLALFNVEYANLQFFFSSSLPPITANAGKARVRGIEVEMEASVTDYLTLSASYSHQDGTSSGIPADAAITPGTAPGGTVPNSYMAAADFNYPFANGDSISAHVDFTHRDPYGLDFNDKPQFVSRTKSMVNANLGYKFGSGWEVSIWGQNLTNENVVIYGNDYWFALYDAATAFGSNPEVITETSQPRYGPPRTYGVTVRYSF